jgi:hypothetical protein
VSPAIQHHIHKIKKQVEVDAKVINQKIWPLSFYFSNQMFARSQEAFSTVLSNSKPFARPQQAFSGFFTQPQVNLLKALYFKY